MVTERSTETAAANRPVYSVPIYAPNGMNPNMRTHKKEHPIGIFLPALDHLVVLFLCDFGIYGKERSRAVTKLRWLIQIIRF